MEAKEIASRCVAPAAQSDVFNKTEKGTKAELGMK